MSSHKGDTDDEAYTEREPAVLAPAPPRPAAGPHGSPSAGGGPDREAGTALLAATGPSHKRMESL